MKNGDLFRLRIVYSGIYSRNVIELAEKLDVPVEDVAKSRGDVGLVSAYEWIRRDVVMNIMKLTQLPDSLNETLIQFADGSSMIVDDRHDLLAKRIINFLKTPPSVEFAPRQLIYISHPDELDSETDE